MGLLDKVFNRGKSTTTAVAEPAACPHTTLIPRWESVGEMGQEDKVTSYTCQTCNCSFTAAEGRALLASEAERIQRDLTS
jgi:hypothetical protein